MANNTLKGLSNYFTVIHTAWKKLTRQKRKKIISLKRKPRSKALNSLWVYAHAQNTLHHLASGTLEWREVDEWNEFLFDLARVQRGESRNAVLKSAKDFLENLPEAEWITERFRHQKTISSGLTQIDTISRQSHFTFWSDLIERVHLDFSNGVSLALTVISTHDPTWLWAQIEKMKNAVVVSVIASSHIKLLKNRLDIARSKNTAISALGTLLFLEHFEQIESSMQLKFEQLQCFTGTELNLRSIKHQWHVIRSQIETETTTLIKELHSDTKDEILAEMLVRTIRYRNPQYDRRPGIAEYITQEILGKEMARRLSEDSLRLKIYVAVLERGSKHSFSVLEEIALHAEESIAKEIRQKILLNLESRLNIPSEEVEDSLKFSAIEFENNYIGYAASTLVHFNKADLGYIGDWFKERFALLPIHTEDRFHNDFLWHKGLERASFLLRLAARVLQFELNSTVRFYVEQSIVDELVSRIPEWEWHRELGLHAPEFGRSETDAVWAVCQHLKHVDTHIIIGYSKTAWVMLAMLHAKSCIKSSKQLNQRLVNDLPIVDAVIAGHISWLLVQAKQWRYLPQVLERFELINLKSKYPTNLMRHNECRALKKIHTKSQYLEGIEELQILLYESSSRHYDFNNLKQFIRVAKVLKKAKFLAKIDSISLKNSLKILKFISSGYK